MKALVRAFVIVVATAIAGYIIWGRVEAYRFDREVRAIAARGEPVDLSSLDAPLPTARHVEAARLYAEAASRAREIGQQDFRVRSLDLDAVVGQAVDVPELEATYLPDAPALQLLDRAAALPFAGFGDADEGLDRVTIQGLQWLNGLAALRADLFAYRGDGDAASRALIAAIGLQRTTAETFDRYILGARQLGSLRILLRHSAPSAASLESLQRAFEALPADDGLVRELMLRRARLIEGGAGRMAPGGVSAPAAMLFQPFLTRMGRIQVEQYQEAIAAARLPWPDKFAVLWTLGATSAPRANGRVVLRALRGDVPNIAAMSSSPDSAGRALALRGVAVTTTAIERYRRAHAGQLPASLDALVPAYLAAVPIDPFTGGALVYKPAGDSYLVYSVDTNRVDNGGVFFGLGSLNPMPQPKDRDFGIKVPLTPRPVRKEVR